MMKPIPVLMLVIVACALDAAVVFSAEPEVKYKSAALRDPFTDVTENKPADNIAKAEAKLRTSVLQGVVISGDQRSAIIDGKVYKVGGKIGLAEIKDIQQDSVIILYNDKEIKLQYAQRKPRNAQKTGTTLPDAKK